MGTAIDTVELWGYLPSESIAKVCPRELLKLMIITGGLPKIHSYDKFVILEEKYNLQDTVDEVSLDTKEESLVKQWFDSNIQEAYDSLKNKFREKTGIDLEVLGYIYRLKYHGEKPGVDLEELTNSLHFVTRDIKLIPNDMDFYLVLIER
jgi:hypothetical protein